MASLTTGRPPFIEQLSQAHYAGLARCVVLTGNIHDLFPVTVGEEVRFVPLEAALHRTLAQARYPRAGGSEHFLVVTLNSQGISFPSLDDLAELSRLAVLIEASPSDPELAELSRKLLRVVGEQNKRTATLPALVLLAEFLHTVASIRARGIRVRPVAVIVDHADSVFPNREVGALSVDDREALKLLYDLLRDEAIWADADTAELRPDFLILLSPTLSEINRKVLALPKTFHVEIGLPTAEDRRRFLEYKLQSAPVVLDYPDRADPREELVQDSRGLTIRALDDLVTRASRAGTPVTRETALAEVNQELQAKLGNVIRIVRPDHDLGDVVGFTRLKRRLAQLQRRIDHPDRAPAGMTVVGPNGSGKTFICEAFAANTGRVVVTFSQIRSQWFGQTDALAEMFESALSVFGRILVLVDEAHVAFGSIHNRDTHETEARLTRSIIQMMDNESNRSNIFWALMTTRPDLLDPDIVRRGRCSLFVPIFDPEGEEAEEFVQWMLRELAEEGATLAAAEFALLRERSRGFSAGDYREFIGDFLEEKDFNPELTLAGFLDSWTPSAVTLADEREYQILQAALRCDWRELLPERLRHHTREQLQLALDAVRPL